MFITVLPVYAGAAAFLTFAAAQAFNARSVVMAIT